MKAEEIRCTSFKDDCISALLTHVMHGWPFIGTEVVKEVKPYWSFRDEVAAIDKTAMKGRRNIIPASLQKTTMNQSDVIHMGIEFTRF